jgi:hypothetical protein
MRYRCSQCGHTTESHVALAEAQLRVQACISCGASGVMRPRLDPSERWWLGIRGERHGPYTIGQLAGLASEGRLSRNSYVWGPGFEAWERAGRVAALAPAFEPRAAVPPPLPPGARAPSRPATRTGMFSGPGPAHEPSVSNALPLPVQDSVIAPLGLPGRGSSSALPTTGAQVRLDDVRKPPPTRFGMPTVVPVPQSSVPAQEAAPGHRAASEAREAVATPAVVAPALPQSPPLPTSASPGAGRESRLPAEPESRDVPASRAARVTTTAGTSAGASAPLAPAVEAFRAVRERPADSAQPLAARAEQAAASPPPARSEAAPAVEVPRLSRAPETGEGDLDDEFFSTNPASLGGDIFAAVDAEAAAGPLDLGALMKDAGGPARARQPTKAEMHALRQEFSVVARLEKHKRKRWLYAVVAAALILGIVAAVMIFAPSRELEYAGRGTSADEGGEFHRPLYEVPEEAGAAPAEVASLEPNDVARAAKKGGGNARAAAQRVASARSVGGSTGAATKPEARISAERFAELTRDEVGKTELKLDFDAAEAARKAEAAAAEKRSAQSGELAEEVAAAFGKKKTQFGRCSDAQQEKVRMLFTVTVTGKVKNVDVQGTSSATKKACIEDILGRAVFPAGDEPVQYSQVLVL